MAPSSNDYEPDRLFLLPGKSAFITGGAGGLGRAIAAAYLRSGAKVAIADLRKAELEAAKAELSAWGDVSTHECDVTQGTSVETAVRGAIANLDKIDILFAAAGLARSNDAVDLPVEEFDLVTDVNIKGTWLSAQAVGRHMIERGEGGKKRLAREGARAEAAVAAASTFKECAERYIKDNEAKWSKKHAAQWPSSLKQYAYPTIGDLRRRDIAEPHFRSEHHQVIQMRKDQDNANETG